MTRAIRAWVWNLLFWFTSGPRPNTKAEALKIRALCLVVGAFSFASITFVAEPDRVVLGIAIGVYLVAIAIGLGSDVNSRHQTSHVAGSPA